MKRFVCLVLCILAICVLFAGCGKQHDAEPDVLSQEQMDEISDAMMQQTGFRPNWHLDDTYLGTCNGVIAFFMRGDLQAHEMEEIAGYTFECNTAFSLHTYHDGRIMYLQDAYEAGLLTEEQIGQIHARYEENVYKPTEP